MTMSSELWALFVDTINISYSTIYLLYPIALIFVCGRNYKIGIEGIVPILRVYIQ